MDAFSDWVEKLDRLIELRGKGRKFDELLTATALEAAYVDHTLMLLVMSGDFEIAKEWVRKSSTTEKRNDK